jgi:pimeloyl-ACP methyl ester carboxylesterase
VTLKTPVAQEVFTFLRPNFEGFGEDGREVNRPTHADIDTTQGLNYPFYRAEAPYVFQRLPELRPSALYVFGESSDLAPAHVNEEKVRRTGKGPGGSGGLQEGEVKAITLTGVGHELPLQTPARTAETIAEWIATEMVDFRREQRDWEQNWKPMPLQGKISIDDQWQKMIGGPPKKAKI